MRFGKLYLTSAVVCVLLISLFSACGGSTKGDLVLFGTLQQDSSTLSFNTRTTSPIVGAVVEALGGSSTTDESGQFFINGDPNNIPAETLIGITLPTRNDGTPIFVAVDTSGSSPIEISLTRNADGSYNFSLLGGSGETTTGTTDTTEDTTTETSEDTSTETTSNGTSCDLSKGENTINSDCNEDNPYCVGGSCVACTSDSDCGINQFCSLTNNTCDDFERPTTCTASTQVCGDGSTVTCLSSCMCDDGFPIGNCSSTCFDTGRAPTQCSDSGLGCSDSSSPVCPF